MSRVNGLQFPAALCLAVVVACAPAPESGRGFSLPTGDPAAGERTFVELQCQSCHTVKGANLIPFEGQKGDVMVELGGETATVKTYGHLVTAVINPSHSLAPGYRKRDAFRDGESLMTVYNETMTVEQLINLVAFLQDHYQVVPPENLYLMP